MAMLISSSNSSILFGVCLVRLFTPWSFPSGPRFSRVVVFVRCSALLFGLYSASRSIFLVRVVFVSSSRRVAVVTVVVCPVTCCMVFVGYVVNVARVSSPCLFVSYPFLLVFVLFLVFFR